MGGMGVPEAVPFSAHEAAEQFVAAHGGRIVALGEVPEGYIFAYADEDEGGDAGARRASMSLAPTRRRFLAIAAAAAGLPLAALRAHGRKRRRCSRWSGIALGRSGGDPAFTTPTPPARGA